MGWENEAVWEFSIHAHSPVHPLRCLSPGNTYRTAVCSDVPCVALSYNWLSGNANISLPCPLIGLTHLCVCWFASPAVTFLCYKYLQSLFNSLKVILNSQEFVHWQPWLAWAQPVCCPVFWPVISSPLLWCLHIFATQALTLSLRSPASKANLSTPPFISPSDVIFFLQMQQWPSLPYIQINTSPPADVFNTVSSASLLGFFLLWLFFF